MYEVFTKLLNMSMTAGILVLVIIVLRLCLKKAPKKYICFLWTLVALRLLCPISISSSLSLLNLMPTVTDASGQINYFQYNGKTEKPVLEFDVPSFANDTLSAENMTVHTSGLYLPAVMYIWSFGVTVMLTYAVISFLQLRKQVSASIEHSEIVYICDEIKSPFILGIIKPRIFLPSGMKKQAAKYVVAHELAHLNRHDHFWKPLGYLLLSVYWFNPILWIAYLLLCKDIEKACDEKVIAEMDKDSIVEYSETLLACAIHRRMITACPIAFGETDVKGRVKNVLSYKKPGGWMICIAVFACIIATVCLLTNPNSNITLSGKLGISMDMAVVEHNRSRESEGNFIVTDYEVLDIKKSSGQTTVYAWVLYEEYSFDGTAVVLESGSHIPTVVTFDTSGNEDTSSYDVIEYWQPQDGSYYESDIRAKFPLSLQHKAFDNSCITEQQERTRRIAEEYFDSLSTVSNIIQTPIKEQMEESSDVIRCVMVDGELYFYTGNKSSVTGRCGNMDGNIDSECSPDEYPTENNQGNFGTGYGYQFGPVEGTIEIQFDDSEWYVFATEKVLASSQMILDQ